MRKKKEQQRRQQQQQQQLPAVRALSDTFISVTLSSSPSHAAGQSRLSPPRGRPNVSGIFGLYARVIQQNYNLCAVHVHTYILNTHGLVTARI